jgi:hypothetical protein
MKVAGFLPVHTAAQSLHAIAGIGLKKICLAAL